MVDAPIGGVAQCGGAMTPDGIQLLRLRFSQWAERRLQSRWIDIPLQTTISDVVQSPIEQMFLIELVFADWVETGGDYREVAVCHPKYYEGNARCQRAAICLIPQYPSEPYSIDIAVIIKHPFHAPFRIAVECDGHDFHERTKEQAQHDKRRDRELQKRGWIVFRFTGSEIYNHGSERAQEIANYCSEVVTRAWRDYVNSLPSNTTKKAGE